MRLRWIMHSKKSSIIFRLLLNFLPSKAADSFVNLLSIFHYLERDVSLFKSSGEILSKKRKIGTSAVIRAIKKTYPLKLAVVSILPCVDQVVIAFNGKQDQVFADEFKKGFAPKYKDNIKICFYENKINSPGDDYADKTILNPSGSIAKFYNWAFSQSDYSTVIKWDDDMLNLGGSCAFKNLRFLKYIKFDGLDVYGQLTTTYEPRTFLLRDGVKYFDSERCEYLNPGLCFGMRLFRKQYLHIKLVKDIFD